MLVLFVFSFIASTIIVGVSAQSSCFTPNMKNGACVPITTCRPIIRLLEGPKPIPTSIATYVRQFYCGTFDNVHHVCCEEIPVPEATSIKPTTVPTELVCTTLSLENGTCVPIVTCQMITTLLERAPKPLSESVKNLVRRSHCGTFNGVHHVCCGLNSERLSTPKTGPRIYGSPEKSPQEIQLGMSVLEATKCGRAIFDRIAHGEKTTLSEFPWLALLVYEGRFGARTADCGGSLISDRYVLTAAHCIRVENKTLVRVRLGEHDISQDIDCELKKNGIQNCADPVQEIDVEEAIYHISYSLNDMGVSNDIGLIRLRTASILSSSVKPICLPIIQDPSNKIPDRMFIAGWGLQENGIRPNILQKGIVPVRENSFCQNVFWNIQVTEKQICAGGENFVDTCRGDSGGPLFSFGRYRRGVRYIQYGIISAGSKRCYENSPGLYVRLSSYISWIAGNIKA